MPVISSTPSITMTHGPREMAARNASRMRWKSASSSVSGTSLSATVAKQERVVRIVVVTERVIKARGHSSTLR